MNKSTLFFLSILLSLNCFGQVSFTKVTDPNNDISSHPNINSYTGATWIDYNSDGLIDLFANSNFLYKNDGNGQFTLQSIPGLNAQSGLGNGNSWGDFDNDGDPDIARANMLSDILENQGSSFLNQTTDRIDITFRGWSCAWGDYNNDGFLDIMMVHPRGFLSGAQKNILYRNNGDGRFTRIFNDLTTDFSAYTGCTWTDFDLDGDLDVFIGSGEVSTLSVDDIFINTLSETGVADLVRLDTGNLANDLRDGQNWNWIDYDNDGDLDGFVTNYFGSKTNDFYRNEGNGNYTLLSSLQIGNIVNQTGPGLGNLWADFDNDGDLDCFITFDGNNQDRYYQNDGGMFFEQTLSISGVGASRGASAGDYDNDGFMDLFVTSANSNTVGLYHNDGNANNWILLDLEGSISNKSAIGAKARLKSNIQGNDVWQIRELNSQNSFGGANDYRIHFGLDTSSIIDSIIIYWPSGQISELSNVMPNQILSVQEEIPAAFVRANFSADSIRGMDSLQVQFSNLSIANPLDSIILYEWDFNGDGIVDSNQKNPFHLFDTVNSPHTITLIVSNGSGNKDTLSRINYIDVQASPVSALENNISQGIKVYPNPANDIIHFDFGANEVLEIQLFDIHGNQAISKIKPKSEFLKVSEIEKGFYIISVKTPFKTIKKKILIQ